MDMSTTSLADVEIGVVIPGYGHPQFLAESIRSACLQTCKKKYVVIVVDDGCKFSQTQTVCCDLMTQFPGRLYYLRQQNIGLSGARNAGVRFLLNACSNLHFVFFLDADNRLSKWSLEHYVHTLESAPSAGWAYPDIRFFGLSSGQFGSDVRETAPSYSILAHLLGNISEAGSLVRAEVFRHGLFFDEAMRQGFEDWDFWLLLLENGYRGVRVEHAGFWYRRRAESMLTESRRGEEVLVEHIRAKHSSLFTPKFIAQLIHRDFPTFALVTDEDDQNTHSVRLFFDPLSELISTSSAEFWQQYRDWHQRPREHNFPEYLILCSQHVRDFLVHEAVWTRAFFWALQNGDLQQSTTVQIASDRSIKLIKGKDPGSLSSVHFVIVPSKTLTAARASGDIFADLKPAIVTIPDAQVIAGDTLSNCLAIAQGQLRQVMDTQQAESRLVNRERRYAGPDFSALHSELVQPICGSELHAPFPSASAARRVCFILGEHQAYDIAPHGEVSKQIAALQADGCEVVLCVEASDRDVDLLRILAGIRDTITDCLAVYVGKNIDAGTTYLGFETDLQIDLVGADQILALAKTCDSLVCHPECKSIAVLGAIKSAGVACYVALPNNITTGHSMTMPWLGNLLAHEHAVQGYWGKSEMWGPVLAAYGIPAEKIISKPNFGA